MSDATQEPKQDFKLPKPELPELAMPPKPVLPEGVDNIANFACDGESFEKRPASNAHIPEPEPGIPRILIGIPCLNFSYEFVTSFLSFWTEVCTKGKGKMQIGYQFMYRKPVHMAEIQLAEIARFNKCTHLLLIDDDIYDFKLSDLEKLLEADKEVIGGVMYASKFPYAMCVFRRYDTSKKVIDMPSDNAMLRLYEVPCQCTKCGTGLSHWDAKFCLVCGAPQDNLIQKADLIPFPFTLIKTSVFDKLKKPWFHCEIEYPSDSWFADRCLEAGIQEYAHMGVRLNHNGVNDTTKPYMFQMEMQKKQQNKNTGLVHISQEDMDKHQYILHHKMKEAEEQLKPQPVMVNVGIEKEEQDDKTKCSVPDGVPEEKSAEVPS
jgi:hypothetical protein